MNAYGQVGPRTAKSALAFVPAGYVVVAEARGDLDKDGQADHVLVIKGTDRTQFVRDEYRGVLDRNRRGLVIALRNHDHYELVLENRACFASENEDGGVYFAPELDVSIDKGKLLVSYAHGRYGGWTYSFRYQNGDFALIGYDRSENRGPVVERAVSANLLTRKMVVRDNINREAEGGAERFKEVWARITLARPIRLRDIADFDDRRVEALLGLSP